MLGFSAFSNRKTGWFFVCSFKIIQKVLSREGCISTSGSHKSKRTAEGCTHSLTKKSSQVLFPLNQTPSSRYHVPSLELLSNLKYCSSDTNNLSSLTVTALGATRAQGSKDIGKFYTINGMPAISETAISEQVERRSVCTEKWMY